MVFENPRALDERSLSIGRFKNTKQALYRMVVFEKCMTSRRHFPKGNVSRNEGGCHYVLWFVQNLLNPYAAGSLFGQYKMTQKAEKWLKPWHMGTHLRVLSESYPINTNMTGFRWFSYFFAFSVHWTKVTSAAEGLKGVHTFLTYTDRWHVRMRLIFEIIIERIVQC